ncbi:MAG TPA: NAD(P)-dependent oxidoreductase [Candidatus Limnocylindrales bacterium]|nr:NAD(P)-dependent oxidoreductase [Candidatus Limnocylindrales bacterium]
MRVAVTGAAGRLGSALVTALGDAPFTGPAGPIAWTRADFDLDAPESIGRLLDRDRPEVVVNPAAWTDVDGCALDPELAMRRNAGAVGILAEATASRGIDLVQISTNAVFAGTRSHDRGYRSDDPTVPESPYGRSKLAGEAAAFAAYKDRPTGVSVVRTAWLFGPPGNDYPTKILAAAERASGSAEPLDVVGDEFGSPSFTHDVADAIVDLVGSGYMSGIHHVVNAGVASRALWARELFRQMGMDVPIREVPAGTWQRPSPPLRWGVLEQTPLPSGEPMRPWEAALADYVPLLRRQRSAAAR